MISNNWLIKDVMAFSPSPLVSSIRKKVIPIHCTSMMIRNVLPLLSPTSQLFHMGGGGVRRYSRRTDCFPKQDNRCSYFSSAMIPTVRTFGFFQLTRRYLAATATATTNVPLDVVDISISDSFDGGNMEVISIEQMTVLSVNGSKNDDTRTTTTTTTMPKKHYNSKVVVNLRIKPDPFTELEQTQHLQYFAFRALVTMKQTTDIFVPTTTVTVEYIVQNAGEASFGRAFEDYTVFYSKHVHHESSDENWRRKLCTKFTNGTLSWTHQYHFNHNLSNDRVHRDNDKSSILYFCYFPPYSYERHLSLIEKSSAYTPVLSLGKSIEGRDMDCVIVGTGPTVCWIIHRQHPGEHMAEFFAEGLLQRVLGLTTGGSVDGAVSQLLKAYTLYIVPNMCPDGAVRGHLRTNAIGSNLNREWCSSKLYREIPSTDESLDPKQRQYTAEDYVAPTLDRSPEVYHVLKKMIETGCDAFVDVHGDEALPFNFVAQPAVPNFNTRLQTLHGAFIASYNRANSDIQQLYGYPAMTRPSSVFNTACKQVAYRFDCLAVTLEMPFKDCMTNPDPIRGWNPSRSKQLGASLVDALLYVHPYLRAPDDSLSFPVQDTYIRPTPMYKT